MSQASSGPSRTGEVASACHLCGGELVEGGLAIPFLGPPRFTYKVKTVEVTVPVEASLCLGCGHVTLRAPDTEPVRQAATALDRASAWSGNPSRPPGAVGTLKGLVGR